MTHFHIVNSVLLKDIFRRLGAGHSPHGSDFAVLLKICVDLALCPKAEQKRRNNEYQIINIKSVVKWHSIHLALFSEGRSF